MDKNKPIRWTARDQILTELAIIVPLGACLIGIVILALSFFRGPGW